jgi:hypothetical protein
MSRMGILRIQHETTVADIANTKTEVFEIQLGYPWSTFFAQKMNFSEGSPPESG